MIRKFQFGVFADDCDVSYVSDIVDMYHDDVEYHIFGRKEYLVDCVLKFSELNIRPFLHVKHLSDVNLAEIKMYDSLDCIVVVDYHKDIQNYIFKLHNLHKLYINFKNVSANDVYHTSRKILTDYNFYNHYMFGVDLSNVMDYDISIDHMDEVSEAMVQHYISQYKLLTTHKILYPYDKLYFSLKDRVLYLNDSVVNSIDTAYESEKYDKCRQCQFSVICPKFNVTSCDTLFVSYERIIDDIINLSKDF
jgi:hypothetical protein